MSQRIYVVWHGKERGVFTEWEKCKDAINGFKGAKYKAFKSLLAGNKAFAEGYELHWGQGNRFNSQLSEEQLKLIGELVYPSISVDAVLNTATNQWEHQGVDTLSGIRIFYQGQFEGRN